MCECYPAFENPLTLGNILRAYRKHKNFDSATYWVSTGAHRSEGHECKRRCKSLGSHVWCTLFFFYLFSEPTQHWRIIVNASVHEQRQWKTIFRHAIVFFLLLSHHTDYVTQKNELVNLSINLVARLFIQIFIDSLKHVVIYYPLIHSLIHSSFQVRMHRGEGNIEGVYVTCSWTNKERFTPSLSPKKKYLTCWEI